MLIYLWDNPYFNSYGSSTMAACAESEEEAKQKLLADLTGWTNRKAAQEAQEYIVTHAADQQGEVINLEWNE